jgi:hypothetical protein
MIIPFPEKLISIICNFCHENKITYESNFNRIFIQNTILICNEYDCQTITQYEEMTYFYDNEFFLDDLFNDIKTFI